MKEVVVGLPDDLEEAVEAFWQDQAVPPDLGALADAALREYLASRGYFAPYRPLRITPAPIDGERNDVSIEHDKYLAEEIVGG